MSPKSVQGFDGAFYVIRQFFVPGLMSGIVGAVRASKSTADTALHQKPFRKNDIAVWVQITIHCQPFSEIHRVYFQSNTEEMFHIRTEYGRPYQG